MRILFWIGQMGDKFGSIERYNVLLAQKCQQRGHEIVIMHDRENTQPQYIKELKEAGARLEVIGDTYADTRAAAIKAGLFILAWKPDVVHIHFVNPIILLILKILKIRLIYKTWHTSIDSAISARTRLIRLISNYIVTRVFAVSDRVVQDEIRAGTRPSLLRKLYLGVPLQSLLENPSDICDTPIPYGFNCPEKKIVITVGRFDEQKGMRYVAEAAVDVIKAHPEVIWWLVGRDGEETLLATQTVKKARLEKSILFLGQRNDVPSLMQKAYIQVVGSIYEGLGLMAIEAAAFGVPTVGTQIGGLNEAIIDGVTGLLVPRKSGQALAKATIELLENQAICAQMGEAAKEHVIKKFDSDRRIDELLDIYETDYKNLFR